MEPLFADIENNKLFTYKVKFDGGNAPNPYGTVCTLAICKPAIRRSARPGDVIVGFGCKSNGDNEKRIIYCMVVSEVLSWKEYINKCSTTWPNKIPNSVRDQGDCIWKNTDGAHNPRLSHSGHNLGDYETDVQYGENVLVADRFWYFGRGDKFKICIEDELPIVNRGHRSASNTREMRQAFADFFRNHFTMPSGKQGEPAIAPETSDERTCAKCRRAEKEDDEFGDVAIILGSDVG